jgi:Queuine tRNA-ribosyltransferase
MKMIKLSEKIPSVASNQVRQFPRTLVVTSCTGEKRHKAINQLTIEDFKDNKRFEKSTQSLLQYSCPANLMYTGKQHEMVMDAVNTLRSCFGLNAVDLKIISAGYGLISEDEIIYPYSVTFSSMNNDELYSWATSLQIHQNFQELISQYELIFILLGNKYLRTLCLPVETKPNQTIIFFASRKANCNLYPKQAKHFVLPLSNVEASKYGYGLVGLKGYLLKLFAIEVRKNKTLLEEVYKYPEKFTEFIDKKPHQLELSLGIDVSTFNQVKIYQNTKKNNNKEYFSNYLKLPASVNTHLKMKYFIPEWDDRVDAGYNFKKDIYSPNRNAYKDDIYAHEIYQEPNYSGILVSKVVVDKRKSKYSDIKESGSIHNFLKFPGEIMGDCGAFGYIKEDQPPYTTVEILDYYQHLGFNYGVSVDHLIVGPFAQPGLREKRYELTLRNAEEFITKHQNYGYSFQPIGVAQGWDYESYGNAVKKIIEMGYDYIALGGIARTPTMEILEILQEVYKYLKPNIKLHLLGVGRIDALPYFRHLGVTSFDSAGPLRSAWLDSTTNYHTMDGKTYAAIRIPFVDKYSVRIKHLLDNGYEYQNLKKLEEDALTAIRKYDKGKLSIDKTLEKLMAYDELLELPRNGIVNPADKARRLVQHTQMYQKLLEEKPWQNCDCPICKQIGVEVVIFRGNDRNRRRGFHNTYVFFKRFQEFTSEKIKIYD